MSLPRKFVVVRNKPFALKGGVYDAKYRSRGWIACFFYGDAICSADVILVSGDPLSEEEWRTLYLALSDLEVVGLASSIDRGKICHIRIQSQRGIRSKKHYDEFYRQVEEVLKSLPAEIA